jgi:hypothetical protein
VTFVAGSSCSAADVLDEARLTLCPCVVTSSAFAGSSWRLGDDVTRLSDAVDEARFKRGGAGVKCGASRGLSRYGDSNPLLSPKSRDDRDPEDALRDMRISTLIPPFVVPFEGSEGVRSNFEGHFPCKSSVGDMVRETGDRIAFVTLTPCKHCLMPAISPAATISLSTERCDQLLDRVMRAVSGRLICVA